MSTPRIKPSPFWRRQASSELFVQDQRQAKVGSFIANLAAMDELFDFAAITPQADADCPSRIAHGWPRARSHRSHGA